MINVTNQLKKESLLNSNYYVTANAVLRDGTTLNLEKEDFYLVDYVFENNILSIHNTIWG